MINLFRLHGSARPVRGVASVSSLPRVVHVVPALFGAENVFGGGERFPLELARAMANRLPTELVAFGARRATRQIGALNIEVLPNWLHVRRFKFDPINPFLLRLLARADIIHYHQTHTMMASLALMYARAKGKPIFTTNLGSGGLGLHRFTDVSRRYSGHLHLSEFSRREFGHADLPTAHVALAGVNTEKFRPDPAVERTDVVYVGRVLPHKGINYLIEGLPAGIPLTIVGRRWRHAHEFGELLDGLAEGKQVNFIEGQQFDKDVWAPEGDDETIKKACQRAICVVLPSVHTTVFGEYYPIPELLGITLLEGMACGAPGITTSICSLPEVVEDGVTGFVVPPNDSAALGQKIQWLHDHPAEARQMGDAARQRVLNLFNWDRVVDRCLEAYGLSSVPVI
jgi:glycosyltransferase involved in cell wall biosynthesis